MYKRYIFSFSLLALGVVLARLHPWLGLILAWYGAITILNVQANKFRAVRLIQWLHAMTWEIPAVFAIFVSRLVPLKLKAKEGSGIPILLVHGYINHSRVWIMQKRWLEKMGLGPIYTVDLGHPFRSIEKYAEKVKRKAEVISHKNQRKDLILVGHSMGGLVCSWYATHLAEKNTVQHVITIGSPLKGTPMAYIAIGPNARQMRPDSIFIQKLRAAMQARSDLHFSHIATTGDQIVWSATRAFLPHHPHKILHDVGHGGLLYSQQVAHQIYAWLKPLT